MPICPLCKKEMQPIEKGNKGGRIESYYCQSCDKFIEIIDENRPLNKTERKKRNQLLIIIIIAIVMGFIIAIIPSSFP